jgi:hypothetical protein
MSESKTKINFNIDDRPQNDKNDLGYGLLGLHQAHDRDGKALNWVGDGSTGKFDGTPEYIQGKDGTLVYKESTVTIFAGNIDNAELQAQQQIYGDPQISKEDVIVSVFTHEGDHNTNPIAITAIRGRQNGGTNNINVEESADEAERIAHEQIRNNRP